MNQKTALAWAAKINLDELKKDGIVTLGKKVTKTLDVHSMFADFKVKVTAECSKLDNMFLTLQFKLNDDAKAKKFIVELITINKRLFFKCPFSGNPCEILFLEHEHFGVFVSNISFNFLRGQDFHFKFKHEAIVDNAGLKKLKIAIKEFENRRMNRLQEEWETIKEKL